MKKTFGKNLFRMKLNVKQRTLIMPELYHLPKISIITPNFNGAQYLEETILSVLGQNYPYLEYIIVDGGSTDGSLEIIKKYEKRLTWWLSEPDNGMYHAIQKGFDRSTGDIMAWINSDDMYHKNALFTVAEIFDNIPNINWLTGANTFYDEFGRTIHCIQSRMFTKFDFYNHDFKWIQQESTFWRRQLWEKTGSSLNVNLKYAGDFELWLRFFQYDRLFVTDALIGGFRYRLENQLSLDHIDEYLIEANFEIDKVIIRPEEKIAMLIYKVFCRFEALFRLVKLNWAAWIIQRFKLRYFSNKSKIVFNTKKMIFVLD